MADMVTAQELENAKIDARTIGESVNENKIVTPRYGAPFKSMPMIAEEMQSVIGTIIAGGVPASIVADASGLSQQQVNNNNESALSDRYTKSESDNLLDDKADLSVVSLKADTFTKSEVNALVAPKADTAYVDAAVGAISTDASKQYATLALANADIANIALNQNIFVSESANGGYWYKATAGATSLTKSVYDPLAQAKKYTDNVDEKNNELRQSVVRYKSDHAYTLTDDFGNIVAYIDGIGHLHLNELPDTVQNMLNQLKNSTVATNELIHTSTSDSNGFHITDYLGNYVLSITGKGELYIPTIDKPVQTVISSMQEVIDFESYFPNIAFQFALSETEKKTDINIVQRFNNIKNRAKASDFILKKSASSLYGENNTTIQRIPALLKLSSTKVLMLFNQGIIGYGGDGDGAKMYQKTITIGANNSIQISETKLFHQVNDIYHAGIVKHAQLCRLQDGRVCCVFEVNLQGVLKYKQYVRYSSDDGQTWTEPTLVTFSNASEIDSITWSTDSKTLVLPGGRLVQAVYLRNEYKVASAYSDDNGLTWTLSPYVASPTGTWHTESTFVRLSDGTIKFWFRDESNPGVKRIYTSTDNGETLQYVGSGNFSCPPCQASSLTLSDGTVVISTPTAINGRTKFKLLFSLDNGQTFDLMTLPFTKTKFMAYSSIIAISDDLLMCAVEGNWGSGAVNTNTFEDIGIFLINTSGALKYGFNS